MNSDKVIREYLKYKHLPVGLRVLDELSVGVCRADVATISEEFCGYEIKSSSDSLTRLKMQMIWYDLFFDRSTLICTTKHADRAFERIPDHWGFFLAEADESGECVGEFWVAREAKPNPNQSMQHLLTLVWCDELLDFLRGHKLRRGCRNGFQMRKRVLENFDAPTIKTFVYQTLLARRDWKTK